MRVERLPSPENDCFFGRRFYVQTKSTFRMNIKMYTCSFLRCLRMRNIDMITYNTVRGYFRRLAADNWTVRIRLIRYNSTWLSYGCISSQTRTIIACRTSYVIHARVLSRGNDLYCYNITENAIICTYAYMYDARHESTISIQVIRN